MYQELFEGLIEKTDAFQVYAKQLEHGLPSFGFRIVEKDRLGVLQVDKLIQLGIQPGPIYQRIKENETVELDNGQIIHRQDFLGPKKLGRIVTILGDTRYLPGLVEFVKDSDVLVHEATFASDEEELAYNYFHSTTKQAAMLAKESNVRRLILTHISSRYQKEDVIVLQNQAEAIFPETTIAFDFYETDIPAK